MRWGGYVAHMRYEMHTEVWLESLKGRDNMEGLGIDERILLEWILVKWGGKVWTGFIWIRIGTAGGLL
jgi:hypothetical protein